MAETAPQKQYRQEFIAGFEYGMNMLAQSTVREFVRQGNEAIFLVADTGGAEAVTRGVNGAIPDRPDNLVQNTCTLTEWHDKPRRTRFNIFQSQGDGVRIMQQGTAKVLNRKSDALIIAQLDTATNDTGAAKPMDLDLVTKSLAILGNNEVDIEEEDNMFGLITPSAQAYLMQVKEFANANYVEVKPFTGPARRYRRWAGINWMVHPRLTGVGTSSEKCYIYHRNAIGYAIDTAGMNVASGYNDEDDYYWSRASAFMGAKLLQQSGIVQVLHDGSAHAAS